jgi:Uma2 family endonuclease
MASKTLLTLEQYAALEEPAGVRYELSEGELIVTPRPLRVDLSPGAA